MTSEFFDIIDFNYSDDELVDLGAVEAEEVEARCYRIAKSNIDRLADWYLEQGFSHTALIDALEDTANDLDVFGE